MAIGGVTVGELQRRMSASEFEEWKIFYQLEPFGELRADLRAGTIAAITANAHRDAKKRRQPFTPRDFMAGYELAEPKPEPSALMGKVAVINAALGGDDRR